MNQEPITDYMVSLPEKRSRNILAVEDKAHFHKKELTPKQKSWLQSHDESNWKDITLKQQYNTTRKIKTENGDFIREDVTKDILWKLPGTQLKRETCGLWKRKGCANTWGHPHNRVFVRQTKQSCFRASCDYCWLEKWLSRESHRATQRIENYIDVFKKLQFARNPTVYKIGKKGKTSTVAVKALQRKYLQPIHVIVSPPWNEKFRPYDELKERAREMVNQAGIEGGLMIYHPFGFDQNQRKWIVRPHFHIVGFGWVVNTPKIQAEDGWVIKNKKKRESIHSTIYYQLSHAGVSESIHAITWFGSLGYRAKYSNLFKVDEEDETDSCDYCHCMLVDFEYVGLDKPPDYEFSGLVDSNCWKAKETLEEAVKKKKPNWKKKEQPNNNPYWNEGCRLVQENADRLLNSLV